MNRLPVFVAFTVVSLFAVGCGSAGTEADGSDVSEAALVADGTGSSDTASRKLVASGKWTVSYATNDAEGLWVIGTRSGGRDKPSLSASSFPSVADVRSQQADIQVPSVVVAFDPPNASAGGGGKRTIEASASCRGTSLRDTKTWDTEAVRCRVNGTDDGGVKWTIDVTFVDSGEIDAFTILGGIVSTADDRWAGHVAFALPH